MRITFLAPLFFFLGLGVTTAAAAVHFIVTRQPPSGPLPTARFVPEGSVRVTTVASPTDRWLLVLRMLLALIVGAAFARPVVVPKHRSIARVVVADVSRAVGSIAAVRDSARALLSEGDVLVIFDSSARVVRRGVADSATTLQRSARPGRLSVALIAALRAATELRTVADSLELAIVSPFRAAELDGATEELRKLWIGRIRLVKVGPSADSVAQAAGFVVRAPADDPVSLAASLTKVMPAPNTTVRIVRDTATADDQAWVESGRHTLVRWPANGGPPGWEARKVDTVGAVVMGETGLVVPLERRWRLGAAARPARIVARWVDGEPAAVESAMGSGCVRDVAIPVPARGDIMLRPNFARLLEALGAPCVVMSSGSGVSDQALAEFGGSGPLAVAALVPTPDMLVTPLMPWLLGLTLLLALAELLVRRRRG